MVECTPIRSCNYFVGQLPLSSLAYPMITHTPPLAGYLLIKTLVARQQPTNVHASEFTLTRCIIICTYTGHIYSCYLVSCPAEGRYILIMWHTSTMKFEAPRYNGKSIQRTPYKNRLTYWLVVGLFLKYYSVRAVKC